MATLECKSVQRGIPSKRVTVEHITDEQVVQARRELDRLIRSETQRSDAVANAFVSVAAMCPAANPSDLWQHVIYRHLLSKRWNDAAWKRVSGFALERAFTRIYSPRLEPHGVRMRLLKKSDADTFLHSIGADIRSTKVDLFLEGQHTDRWIIFGAAHVKSSIAERIQDDVPASAAFMSRGFASIALTMDAKSYPPPHGNCINYGELGGRSLGVEKARIKRGYIETFGQFDGLFSFNLRTPASEGQTASGKRIYTLPLYGSQPDALVVFILERWNTWRKANLEKS